LQNQLFIDLIFKIIISVAAIIIIAQFGKFQIPFEFYYIWKLITLGSPNIYEGIGKPESFNKKFRNSKIIYGFNGIYKIFALTKDKSTAIGFYEHLDLDAKIAKKDLFKSILRISFLIFNRNDIIKLNLVLNQIENKFPNVLDSKQAYLIQSIILVRLGIRLNEDILSLCFDLSVDETENVFKGTAYKLTDKKIRKVYATLSGFEEEKYFSDNLYIALQREFVTDITNGEEDPVIFRLRSTFVNYIRGEQSE